MEDVRLLADRLERLERTMDAHEDLLRGAEADDLGLAGRVAILWRMHVGLIGVLGTLLGVVIGAAISYLLR